MKKQPAELTTKGYKVTDSQMKCKGFQYELKKRIKISGPLKLCNNGIHFCERLSHCFNYYSFDKSNRVFEIISYGDILTEGNKSCTAEIELVRELTWQEVLTLANEGTDNVGHSNTGDRNTGDRNTGDSNTGDRNTGYRNTGDSNTGDRNTGYRNTGDRNTGDRNTGYSNTGDRNTGDRNTGYSNTGDRNTGAFCTGEPVFTMFNKPSKWTAKQFLESKPWQLIVAYVDTKLWVPANIMTEQEKKDHRGWERAEGFYRDIPYKEAFGNMWHNLSKDNKQSFLDMPNFDSKIFEEITGVKI
jgi:hypothetical protein